MRRRSGELIRKLHNYNELKDITVVLLGKIAAMEGCTTKELYARFDLSLED